MMNKQLLLEDKINIALKNVVVPEEFGGIPDEDRYDMSNDVWWQIRQNLAPNEDSQWFTGVSKMVVSIDNYPYVIKLPYSGSYYVNSGYDHHEHRYISETIYEPFYNADCEEEGLEWNYCQKEIELLEEIKEDGYEDFFPKTIFWGLHPTAGPVYLQEKVEVLGNMSYKEIEKRTGKTPAPLRDYVMKERKTNPKSYYSYLPKDWVILAVDYYGMERTNNFIQYLKKTGMISDLHNSNVGFDVNGKPIIIDWAGFEN